MAQFYGNRLIILIMEEDTQDLLRPLTPIQLKIDYTLIQTVLANRMARMAKWIQRVQLELNGVKQEEVRELGQRISDFEKKIQAVLNPAQLRKLRAVKNKEVKQLDQIVIPKNVQKDSGGQQTESVGADGPDEEEFIDIEDPNVARITKLEQEIQQINQRLTTFKNPHGSRFRQDPNKTVPHHRRQPLNDAEEGSNMSFGGNNKYQGNFLDQEGIRGIGAGVGRGVAEEEEDWEAIDGAFVELEDHGTVTNSPPDKENKSIQTYQQRKNSKIKQKNPNQTHQNSNKIHQNIESCLKRLEEYAEKHQTLEKQIFTIKKSMSQSVSKTFEQKQEQLHLKLREFTKANGIIAEYTNSNTEKISALQSEFLSLPKALNDSQERIQQSVDIQIDQVRRSAEQFAAGLHQLLSDKVSSLAVKLNHIISSEKSLADGDTIQPGGNREGTSQHGTARNIKEDDNFSSTTTRYRKGDNKAFQLNCKVEVLEHHVKTMAEQVKEYKDELQKNKKKDKTNLNNTMNNSKGFLPKIHKIESVKSIDSHPQTLFDAINLQMRRLHERLTVSEETLKAYKTKLRKFEEMCEQTPAKIIELEKRFDTQNQIRQQRLLEIIKELINRCLTDPFNNQFTSVLKKQIHVKFLEIRHQYHGILKQIQKKVENRADQKELVYLKEKFEAEITEIKALLSKKCDSQEFRKSVRFLETKVKDLHLIVKNSEQTEEEIRREHSLSIYTRR